MNYKILATLKKYQNYKILAAVEKISEDES